MIVDKETGWAEAEIVINGQPLSFAESMSVRMAVSSYRMFISENKRDIGERLAAGYDHHLGEVENKMRKKS